MFGLALCDSRQKALMLGRDPFCIKLYVTHRRWGEYNNKSGNLAREWIVET
jgi:asparagine synthetase B (glutamine-hydrolysing)